MGSKLGKHFQKKTHKCRVQLYLHHIIRHLMHLEEPIVSNPRQCLALLQEMEMFTDPVSYSSLLDSATVTLTISSKHRQPKDQMSYVAM